MKNKNGILTIAFGEQYDKLAAHAIEYSRKFTKLPVVVLTNIKKRHNKWNSIKNVQFIEFDLDQTENREIKTTMYKYTPFEKTLYIDCDSIIQNQGIEVVFNYIGDNNIALCLYDQWNNQNQIHSTLYQKAINDTYTDLPISIYYGSIIGFGKNNQYFFNKWNWYWKLTGKGREMPSLACAVKNSKVSVIELDKIKNIFSWQINQKVIVQHEYGTYIRNKIGCNEFKPFKPFDKNIIIKKKTAKGIIYQTTKKNKHPWPIYSNTAHVQKKNKHPWPIYSNAAHLQKKTNMDRSLSE